MFHLNYFPFINVLDNLITCTKCSISTDLTMASSSEPNVGIDIKEEMEKPYVKAYRSQFKEKDVSDETLVTAIELLSRINGGKSHINCVHGYTATEYLNLADYKI